MANVELSVVEGTVNSLEVSIPGVQGPPGEGVPSGGTANQVLIKKSSDDYDAEWKLVEGNNIADSSIGNAKIAANANIPDTKLATISSAGKVANSATSATAAGLTNTIVLRDGTGSFSAGSVTTTGLTVNGNAQVSGLTVTSVLSVPSGSITTGMIASGVLGTAASKDVGTTAGTVAAGDDGRFTDARSPIAHKTTHAIGGSDELTPADIGAEVAGAAQAVADTLSVVATTGDYDDLINLPDLSSAGSTGQIQYNENGQFAASADLTWDDTGKELGVGGDINLDDGGTFATTLQMVTATANRTISFPDATGTVALVAGSSGQLIYNAAGALAGGGVFDAARGTLGYPTGGTITQATSKSTGVTLNGASGRITLNAAALAANTTVSFTLTNSAITANDLLLLNHVSGGTAGAYVVNAQTGAGTASINVRNITSGSLSEAIVIGFAIIKA